MPCCSNEQQQVGKLSCKMHSCQFHLYRAAKIGGKENDVVVKTWMIFKNMLNVYIYIDSNIWYFYYSCSDYSDPTIFYPTGMIGPTTEGSGSNLATKSCPCQTIPCSELILFCFYGWVLLCIKQFVNSQYAPWDLQSTFHFLL